MLRTGVVLKLQLRSEDDGLAVRGERENAHPVVLVVVGLVDVLRRQDGDVHADIPVDGVLESDAIISSAGGEGEAGPGSVIELAVDVDGSSDRDDSCRAGGMNGTGFEIDQIT